MFDLDSVFELGRAAIERIWPDPIKRAEEVRKLEELKQSGDIEKLKAHVQLMTGQIEINKIDAKSGKWFQANWRPMIGWVGAVSIALMYIPKSIMMTGIWGWQCYEIITIAESAKDIALPAFPDLGASDIIGLLGSLLGVAAMRSYDKKNGIDTK